MGRLRTVSLILILCASGGATAVAATDDTTSATRQPPPAPPIKYLEAGSQLFNSGDVDKLELASKYLQAADRYRDMLEPDERKTLDAYLKELGKAKAAMAPGARPPRLSRPQRLPPARARWQQHPRRRFREPARLLARRLPQTPPA